MGLFGKIGSALTGMRVGWNYSADQGASDMTRGEVDAVGKATSNFFDLLRGTKSTQSSGTFKALSTTEQLNAMKNSEIVYACVKTIYSAFQEAPIVIEQYVEEEADWVTRGQHPLLDPFRSNPELSESLIKSYHMMHLNLTGASFLWKWRDGATNVREIWPVPPDWVKIVPVKDMQKMQAEGKRIIDHYKIKAEGMDKEIIVPPEDMVYTRFPDPTSLWKPLSPVTACSKRLQLEWKGVEHQAEIVDNLKLPGIAITTSKRMGNDQKDDLRSALQAKMGQDARDNAMIMSGPDIKLQLLNPLESFDWKEFASLNETRICMAFGVPPICIGAKVGLENSPWSNTGDAKRWLYRNTIAGLWGISSDALSSSLVPEGSEDVLRYAYDLSEVKELQETADELASRAGDLWQRGLATKNEARMMAGFEKVAGGDVFLVSANMMMVPANVDLGTVAMTDDENHGQPAGFEEVTGSDDDEIDDTGAE